MLNLKNQPKQLYFALLGAILLTINIFTQLSPIIGILGMFLFAIPLCLNISSFFKPLNEGKVFFGSLAVLSSDILLTTLAYYIYGITPLISFIILMILLASFWFAPQQIHSNEQQNKIKTIFTRQQKYLIAVFFLLETILISTLVMNKTTDLMPSPWSAVKPWFFVLYAVATGILLFVNYKTPSAKINIFLNSLHLFTTFIVTAILYPLGWGFDAFVHRATEIWIFNNGFVQPKQPYYIGQYSFVVWLSQLTQIPVFYIDIYLVPILASFTIPATIIYSLKKTWNIGANYAGLFVWLVPFVPFLYLNLTTPHNVVLLFSILIVFTTLAHLKNNLPAIVPFLLALAAVCTHPLVGAPIFVFVITSLLIKRYQNNRTIFVLSIIASFFTLIILLPAMFILNNLRAGAGWPTFSNPFLRLDYFLALFARPYWYAKNTPIIFETLYAWQLMIVPTTIALGLTGFIHHYKKTKDKMLLVFPLSAIGFILSAWLLRSWVTFPDVVSYEQGDFPLRLIKASILFLLPFAAYILFTLIQYIEKQKNKKIYLGGIVILSSILLMLSFYLSYPQRNIKARFPGLNVTQSDFKAVEWIHNQHTEYDYIVLSNQLVSAAALTNYSFAKYFNTPNGEVFYYSVPTGGLLYQQYGKMLYEGQHRQYMIDAMDLVGVKKAYFVLNSYWAGFDKIKEGAERTADSWTVLDDGKVWIFEYNR